MIAKPITIIQLDIILNLSKTNRVSPPDKNNKFFKNNQVFAPKLLNNTTKNTFNNIFKNNYGKFTSIARDTL